MQAPHEFQKGGNTTAMHGTRRVFAAPPFPIYNMIKERQNAMKKALAMTMCALCMVAIFAGCTNKGATGTTTALTSATSGTSGISTTPGSMTTAPGGLISTPGMSSTTGTGTTKLKGVFGDAYSMMGRADAAVRDLLGGGKATPATGEAKGRIYTADLFGDRAEIQTKYGTDKNVSSVEFRFTKADVATVKTQLTDAIGTEPTEKDVAGSKQYTWTVEGHKVVLTEKNKLAYVTIE